jgi:hypothetical protein
VVAGSDVKTPVAATREDHDAVYRLSMAQWGTQVTKALARLPIAELLAARPLTAHQIAAELSSDPDMTYRLLQTAAALGYVFERQERNETQFASMAARAGLRITRARQLHWPYVMLEAVSA